jgi:hypothetical protein
MYFVSYALQGHKSDEENIMVWLNLASNNKFMYTLEVGAECMSSS